MIEISYVITWRYSDGSGSGAVAAFATNAGAEKMVGILNQQDSMRLYKIEAVPFEGGGREPNLTGGELAGLPQEIDSVPSVLPPMSEE